MPYNRPGAGVYVTNGSGGTYTHGQPVVESNFVGVTVKQQAPLPTDSLATTKLIANGENYFLITKGIVQVPVGGVSPAKGTAVYITSGNVLTTTVGSNAKFGRIVAIAGQRGTPTGQMRIDLDTKDSF